MRASTSCQPAVDHRPAMKARRQAVVLDVIQRTRVRSQEQLRRSLHVAGFDGYVVNECFTDAPLDRACTAGYQTLSAALADCEPR